MELNKHVAIFTNLYWADTWEGPEGVRLVEVSLYQLSNFPAKKTFYRGGVCVNTLEKLIYYFAFDNYLFRFASFSAHFLLFLVQ